MTGQAELAAAVAAAVDAAGGQVTMPALVTVPAIDIVAAGQWNLSTGPVEFTPDDLAAAVQAADCPSVGWPVIKIGHTDPAFATAGAGGEGGDGTPALGRVTSLELGAEGSVITGDLAGMPGWLAAILPSAYPNRSVEATHNYVCQQGHVHPFAIHALALLGVTPPGVGVLGGLDQVAALYGVAASAPPPGGGPMGSSSRAAAVTSEDVRRAYYELGSTPYSHWITELQMDPAQLIVADEATRKTYRVPFTIKGQEVAFADAVEVEVEYQDVAAGRHTGRVEVWASALDSRAGVAAKAIGSHSTACDTGTWSASSNEANLADDATAATLRSAFAWEDPAGDAATKAAYRFIHHFVASDGTVGAASTRACSSGIGVLNGGRGGTTIPDADKQGVYNHLARHLRDADMEPPAMAAAPGHDHGGGDPPPPLPPAPAGPGRTAPASAAGPAEKGAADMQFSDEQMAALRTNLGLGDDVDVTAEAVLTALTAKTASAGGRIPPGAKVVDAQTWDDLQAQVRKGEEYRAAQQTRERDLALDNAIHEGRIAASRRDHWARVWNADPEGTKAILGTLQPGTVPVHDLGTPGEDPDVDEEFASLYPPAQRR